MGKRVFRTSSAWAAWRPDFRAICKSMDCLYTRALTFEPLFKDSPPASFRGLQRPPPPRKPFFPLPIALVPSALWHFCW